MFTLQLVCRGAKIADDYLPIENFYKTKSKNLITLCITHTKESSNKRYLLTKGENYGALLRR